MTQLITFCGGALFCMGIWFSVSATRKARRLAIMRQPFPPAWHELLLKGLPPYAHLPQPLQERLQAYTMLFLAEKHFEGCGGQEISDEVRVTISAQACLLLIGQQTKCYPKLRSVLVYPHTYIAGGKGSFGAQHEAPSARLGESWQTGVVVLSWNSVKGGATNFDDGQNVTLHEFAHQLDQEDGAADGTPILKDVSCYRPWSRALTKEYSNFLSRVKKHRKTVVDRYGATNPAEYFATATEAFFEKPDQLSEKQPDLFDALQQYYQLDPRNWS